MAAAKDYEQLDVRATELRQVLAGTPLVATSDSLPEAFAATLGRLTPLDGRVGVAILLTVVIEIMSCFGLAALRALAEESGSLRNHQNFLLPDGVRNDAYVSAGAGSPENHKLLPQGAEDVPSNSSLTHIKQDFLTNCVQGRNLPREPSSNVFQLPTKTTKGGGSREESLKPAMSSETVVHLAGSHVAAFVADCLVTVLGASLATADIRMAYEAWCVANGHEPLSQQKLSAELLRLEVTDIERALMASSARKSDGR